MQCEYNEHRTVTTPHILAFLINYIDQNMIVIQYCSNGIAKQQRKMSTSKYFEQSGKQENFPSLDIIRG